MCWWEAGIGRGGSFPGGYFPGGVLVDIGCRGAWLSTARQATVGSWNWMWKAGIGRGKLKLGVESWKWAWKAGQVDTVVS